MARRRAFGPTHRISGYARGDKFTDFKSQIIGKIVQKRCNRVSPGQRGDWISSERCSYVVEIDGRRYVGRGRGDGMHVNLRQMKRR